MALRCYLGSIRLRLAAGLALIVLIAVIATGVLFVSLQRFDRAIADISERRLPALTAASQLAQGVKRTVVIAPQVVATEDRSLLQSLADEIAIRIERQNRLIGRLRLAGMGAEELESIVRHRDVFVRDLLSLSQVAGQRIDANGVCRQNLLRLRRLCSRLDEQEAALSPARRTGPAGRDGADARPRSFEQWLLRNRDAIILMLSAPTASSDQELRDLASRTADLVAQTERHMSGLPASMQEPLKPLQTEIAELVAVESGIFTARARQLLLNGQTQEGLVRADAGARRLIRAIDQTFARAEASIVGETAGFSRLVAALSEMVILSLLFCVIAGVLIAIYLQRSVIGRVLTLRNVMLEHAEGRGAPIPSDGTDEISQMARSVGYFVDEIEHREAALRKYQDHLQELVDERTEELNASHERLRESEERYRRLIELSPDITYRLDRDGGIAFISRGIQALGYEPEELIGRPFSGLVSQDDLAKVQYGILERRTGNRASRGIELCLRRKQGETDDGLEAYLDVIVSARGLWDVTDEEIEEEGKHFLGTQGVMHDVTERKKAEEAKMAAERELEKQRLLSLHSDRLRSLGEMATGIAHELNQPLLGVRGLAQHIVLAKDRGWEMTESKIREMLELIIQQADRMKHIVEHVRVFAVEAGKPKLEPVNVNEVVMSATGLLDTQFRSRGLDLQCELGEALPLVQANPYSLEEVVLNLVLNARDAVEERLHVNDNSAPPRVLVRTFLESDDAGRWAKVEVADTGVGIPPDLHDKIFDAFFTTKEAGKGTGLGLSISKSIAQQFGGTLAIARSTPEQGTSIVVSLPVGGNGQESGGQKSVISNQ